MSLSTIIDTTSYSNWLEKHAHTHLAALCPGLPRWAGARKVKTNLDFTEARYSEWQWHQLGHMQVCTLLQTDSRTSTPPLLFFTGQMPFLPPNQQRQIYQLKTIWYKQQNKTKSTKMDIITSNQHKTTVTVNNQASI